MNMIERIRYWGKTCSCAHGRRDHATVYPVVRKWWIFPYTDYEAEESGCIKCDCLKFEEQK